MPGLMKRFRLFEAFNVPIYVDVTFIVIAVMCIASFGSVCAGIMFAVLLAFSIVTHEFGHSLTARMFGFKTHDITLSVLGGCASLVGAPTKPAEELAVAVMGPVVSFLLFGLGFVLWSVIGTSVLAAFWQVNIMLGIFNLMPGFPMDGGRVLRAILCSFMPRCNATWWAMVVGRGFAALFGLYGLGLMCAGNANGLIAILIAVMIWRVGYAEYMNVVYSGGRC